MRCYACDIRFRDFIKAVRCDDCGRDFCVYCASPVDHECIGASSVSQNSKFPNEGSNGEQVNEGVEDLSGIRMERQLTISEVAENARKVVERYRKSGLEQGAESV